MSGARYLGRDALRNTTAPALLRDNVKCVPDDVAYVVLREGLPVSRTWTDYASRVAQTAKLLDINGVRPGDRVVIYADLCEEWIICDMAAQSLGAIVCGIYPTSSQHEVTLLLAGCGPVLALAGSREQATTLLKASLKASLNVPVFVLADDQEVVDGVKSFTRALAEVGRTDLAWLWARVAEVKAEMPAFIVFTSGTGGDPKGALVAHGKHLAAASTMVDHFGLLRPVPHTTAVYLPPCHVLGRNFAITLPLIAGVKPYFGGPATPLPVLLRVTKPTVMLFVPRLLQKFAAQVVTAKNEEGFVARWLFQAGVTLGKTRQTPDLNEGVVAAFLRHLTDSLVIKPILRQIGFDRLELVISGGAAVPSAAMTFWHRLGVNVVQGYGTTETAGAVIAAQNGLYPKPGRVGTAPQGCDLKLADDGEILVRHPDVFDGYWNDIEATKAVKLADGWLRTGDIGRWEDGELVLIDRARDFIVTSGGKTIAPSFVENALRSSPFVAEAIVFGHGRKYLTALLELDFDAAAGWVRMRGHQIRGPLGDSGIIKELMRSEMNKANQLLARVEQIKDFRLIPRALVPGRDGEPITATRKVRRAQMYLAFRDLVESMYDDVEEQSIAAAMHLTTPEGFSA